MRKILVATTLATMLLSGCASMENWPGYCALCVNNYAKFYTTERGAPPAEVAARRVGAPRITSGRSRRPIRWQRRNRPCSTGLCADWLKRLYQWAPRTGARCDQAGNKGGCRSGRDSEPRIPGVHDGRRPDYDTEYDNLIYKRHCDCLRFGRPGNGVRTSNNYDVRHQYHIHADDRQPERVRRRLFRQVPLCLRGELQGPLRR